MTKIKKQGLLPDPTIPDVSVEVDGSSYRLCFDFEALARAKAMLRKAGVEVNILRCLDFREVDVDTLPLLFFAAAHRFQPELSYAEAQRAVSLRTAEGILSGIFAAYTAAMSKDTANPPEPQQS